MFNFYSNAERVFVIISKVIEKIMSQAQIINHSSIYSTDISTIVQSILQTANSLENSFGELTSVTTQFTQEITNPPAMSSY